ncbi:hypothetical protein B0F88_102373 [Methylobacter tundripaludum]|uniref:Uncharacterized protein n=1 Tax=Methylobacter tundripaludum TaxID=173365 RepID=A0A2S6H7E7_9GAMM|nr:hypothetical protein B0F88_102373 [Methylobacter tundripaludum]
MRNDPDDTGLTNKMKDKRRKEKAERWFFSPFAFRLSPFLFIVQCHQGNHKLIIYPLITGQQAAT